MNILKLIPLGVFVLILNQFVLGQKIYNPNADAKKDIAAAVAKAQKEDKHVLLQIGGNWCPWCIKLHNYLDTTAQLKQLMEDNYVFVLVNYSKKKQHLNNVDLFRSLGYPQRFGFPVLVVLDGQGQRIHTQNTAILEKDKGYDFKKVKNFLYHWRPDALKDENYK